MGLRIPTEQTSAIKQAYERGGILFLGKARVSANKTIDEQSVRLKKTGRSELPLPAIR